MLAEEEDGGHAGAGVGAHDGADVVDEDMLHTEALLHGIGQELGIGGAVAVADEDGVAPLGIVLLRHPIQQVIQGSLAAPALGAVFQLAAVIHPEDGLDVQHGAHHGGGSADTAAPLQVHQVLHGDPVADVQLVLLHPGGDLGKGLTLAAELCGGVDQQALAHGGAEGVDDDELSVVELLPELLGGDDGGLIGGAQGRGEGQHQHIPALLKSGADGGSPAVGIDGGGLGQLAVSHVGVQLSGSHLALPVGTAVQLQAQGCNANLQLGDHLGGQVTARIGNDLKIHRKHSLSKLHGLARGTGR